MVQRIAIFIASLAAAAALAVGLAVAGLGSGAAAPGVVRRDLGGDRSAADTQGPDRHRLRGATEQAQDGRGPQDGRTGRWRARDRVRRRGRLMATPAGGRPLPPRQDRSAVVRPAHSRPDARPMRALIGLHRPRGPQRARDRVDRAPAGRPDHHVDGRDPGPAVGPGQTCDPVRAVEAWPDGSAPRRREGRPGCDAARHRRHDHASVGQAVSATDARRGAGSAGRRRSIGRADLGRGGPHGRAGRDPHPTGSPSTRRARRMQRRRGEPGQPCRGVDHATDRVVGRSPDPVRRVVRAEPAQRRPGRGCSGRADAGGRPRVGSRPRPGDRRDRRPDPARRATRRRGSADDGTHGRPAQGRTPLDGGGGDGGAASCTGSRVCGSISAVSPRAGSPTGRSPRSHRGRPPSWTPTGTSR